MNRRQWMMLSGAAATLRPGYTQAPAQSVGTPDTLEKVLPDKILLKDYRPKSIYKIPQTDIKKAKYPVVDVHCHGARPVGQLPEWVKTMDAAGVEKAVIFTGASSAERFAEIRQTYAKYPGRFELWCGFELSAGDPVKALEDCHRAGAVGVGEVSDKGWGFASRPPGSRAGSGAGGPARGGVRAPNPGPHPDDPRMDALWDKCAQLGMPVNIHVSDPIWAYQPMDNTNDGLMNGYTWRIDDKQPGILGHDGLIQSLERALEKHRKTVFIACHLANLDYDLTRLGGMFERHPNLYADISARFAETAPIPRFVNQFLRKYTGRVLYGTDMPYTQRIFSATFRVLESSDEHFYERDLYFNFDYHWPMHGLGLPDSVLKKVYRDNAVKAFQQARA
jgi:predicted TIM-barrel fold metal-dependent hydrolase